MCEVHCNFLILINSLSSINNNEKNFLLLTNEDKKHDSIT